MKISVITLIYKVEPWVERSLRSLLGQTMTEGVEFIIVDDASPDKSVSIVERVAAEYPAREVHIIRHAQNQGAAAARQTGMDAAQGEYTIQIDGDDWVEHDMLASMWAVAQSENADIVVCDYFVNYPKGQRYVAQPLGQGAENVGLLLSARLHGSLSNKLIRRSLYVDNNIRTLPGLNMREDLLLCLKLFEHSERVVYLPKAFLHYVQRAGSITSAHRGRSFLREVIYRSRLLTWLMCRFK